MMRSVLPYAPSREEIESISLVKGKEEAAEIARSITEMIYKEEKILFPLTLEKLADSEWGEMRRGDDEIGYAFEPPVEWSPTAHETPTSKSDAQAGTISLSSGQLTQQELDRILTHLPVDLSFVDPEGRMKFYSDNPERIFPRSPAVIGRDVAHCHPPESVDTVLKILAAFKEGFARLRSILA